jgi:hypothetical protein
MPVGNNRPGAGHAALKSQLSGNLLMGIIHFEISVRCD